LIRRLLHTIQIKIFHLSSLQVSEYLNIAFQSCYTCTPVCFSFEHWGQVSRGSRCETGGSSPWENFEKINVFEPFEHKKTLHLKWKTLGRSTCCGYKKFSILVNLVEHFSYSRGTPVFCGAHFGKHHIIIYK
jgi:hypothetical protein